MGAINSIALSKDQNRIISVGQEKSVSVWDLRVPDPVCTVDHGSEGMSVCCSNNGNLFATGGTGQIVRLWDYRSTRPLYDGIGHSGTVMSIKFSPDDKQVTSTADDGSIILWNVL